jgi:uncharacterized cupredoxin-like copper-binding protein
MRAFKSALLRFAVIASAIVAVSYPAIQQSSLAHEGHDFAAGEPGNPKRTSKTIVITMRESNGKMLFSPDRIEVRQNEQIKFVLTNAGHLDHEFMIATPEENQKHAVLMQKYPDMVHEDPNGRTVKTKAKSELIWRFTKKGTFEFACLIPGHYESGMYGTIIVK